MELRKLAVALDNAKEEIKQGITAGFEQEILNESFKEFADLYYILTGEMLGSIQLMEYLDWLECKTKYTPKIESQQSKTPF